MHHREVGGPKVGVLLLVLLVRCPKLNLCSLTVRIRSHRQQVAEQQQQQPERPAR